MAQSAVVMAFRKRLKSYGYQDISIIRDVKTGLFTVTACEPLAGQSVALESSEWDLDLKMRK